jgi:putative addiction module component (TIGR02574 family)
MNVPNIDLDALTTDEQIALMEAIWERLSRTPSALQLSQEQEEELDRRLDRIDRDGVTGPTWDEVRDELLKKYR